MQDSTLILRHILATIAYRLSKSIKEMDEAFFAFGTPNGIRKPIEIIRHISSIISYMISEVTGLKGEKLNPLENHIAELERLQRLLTEADRIIEGTDINIKQTLRLIQGPLTDAVTHLGQLAMLRRLYHAPVDWENFMQARIETGNVKLDQIENMP